MTRRFVQATVLVSAIVPIVGMSSASGTDVCELSAEQRLVVAAYHLDACSIQRLVASGVDVNARLGQHPTRLFDAAGGERAPVVSESLTPLLAAAWSLKVPRSELNDDARGAESREMPLGSAEQDQERQGLRLEVVRMLLDAGADVNQADARGGTALSVSVARGHDDIVALLLSRGAEMDTQADIYIDGTGGIAPLHLAVGRESTLRVLLEAGPDVDIRDEGGETALHWAVWNENVKAVALLLEHEADPTICSKRGLTPADVIARYKSPDVGCLIDRRVRETPRGQLASEEGEVEYMRRLLRSAARSRAACAGRFDGYSRWLGSQGLSSGAQQWGVDGEEAGRRLDSTGIQVKLCRLEDIDVKKYQLVLTHRNGEFHYVSPVDIRIEVAGFVVYGVVEGPAAEWHYVRVLVTGGVLKGATVNIRCPLVAEDGSLDSLSSTAAIFVVPGSLDIVEGEDVPFKVVAAF